MLVLLLLTGGAGFGASVLLLRLGVEAMAVRYPIAVLAGYAAFLGLLRLWLWSMTRKARGRGHDPDFDPNVLGIEIGGGGGSGGGGGGGGGGVRFGGGGGYRGGGAGRAWEEAPVLPFAGSRSQPGGDLRLPSPVRSSGGGRGGGGGLLGDLDLGDDAAGCLVLALVGLAVVGVAAVAGYAVALAPALLAEVVVDGIVLAGLYTRVRKIDEREWFRTALRKTWVPALLAAALLGGVGHGIQRLRPDARSIGDVWRQPPAPARLDEAL